MFLDVNEINTIEEAKKAVESKVGDRGLNLLLNNAGVNKKASLEEVTPAMMLDTYNTNVNGPLFTTKAGSQIKLIFNSIIFNSIKLFNSMFYWHGEM